jgi:hypothetical protein
VESKLGPLGTSATECPIVPAPGDYDGRIWWNEHWQGKPKSSEKTCLLQLSGVPIQKS